MILTKYLKISNVKELFLKDQLGLVKQLVQMSLINLPFQNMTTFGAFLPNDRKTPGYRDLLASTTKGEGGLCGHLNNLMILTLESLGYHVELVAGCFRRTGIPMSHFLVKVKIPGYAIKGTEYKPMDSRKDKTFLIDVGCGIPLHEPVDLDMLPYYGYAGGLRYRYERVDANTIERVNECGDAIMGKKSPSFVSPQDYTIDLNPRKHSEFQPSVHAVYSNPRSVFLHQGVYSFRYLDITDDDFRIVCVRGKDLMLITKETRHVQSFDSYEKLKPNLLKYFPMVNTNAIDLTVKHFSIPFEEAIKMSSS